MSDWGTKKTAQNALQEELFRERIAVLARAGERVVVLQAEMERLEVALAAAMEIWNAGIPSGRKALWIEINDKICTYNLQREYLQRRYYELIVTREALGLIHHRRLEEFYRIPPRKKTLPPEF